MKVTFSRLKTLPTSNIITLIMNQEYYIVGKKIVGFDLLFAITSLTTTKKATENSFYFV